MVIVASLYAIDCPPLDADERISCEKGTKDLGAALGVPMLDLVGDCKRVPF